MHFMNPPPIMQLIEIVRGTDTSDEVFDTIKALAKRLARYCLHHSAFLMVHMV